MNTKERLKFTIVNNTMEIIKDLCSDALAEIESLEQRLETCQGQRIADQRKGEEGERVERALDRIAEELGYISQCLARMAPRVVTSINDPPLDVGERRL